VHHARCCLWCVYTAAASVSCWFPQTWGAWPHFVSVLTLQDTRRVFHFRHALMRTCAHTHTYTHTHTCTCAHTFKPMHSKTKMQTHAHPRMHTHAHTHKRTHTRTRARTRTHPPTRTCTHTCTAQWQHANVYKLGQQQQHSGQSFAFSATTGWLGEEERGRKKI